MYLLSTIRYFLAFSSNWNPSLLYLTSVSAHLQLYLFLPNLINPSSSSSTHSLYCTALYCTALHCTVLYCTALCRARLSSSMSWMRLGQRDTAESNLATERLVLPCRLLTALHCTVLIACMSRELARSWTWLWLHLCILIFTEYPHFTSSPIPCPLSYPLLSYPIPYPFSCAFIPSLAHLPVTMYALTPL